MSFELYMFFDNHILVFEKKIIMLSYSSHLFQIKKKFNVIFKLT